MTVSDSFSVKVLSSVMFFVSGYIMYRPCPSAQVVLPEGTFNFMATKNNIFSV